MMIMMEEKKIVWFNLCAYCRSEIEDDEYAVGTIEGKRKWDGFIPVEDLLLFCSRICVVNHFSLSKDDIERSPKRIP